MKTKYLASTMLAAALSFGAAHATTITINGGGSSLAYPTYVAEFAAYTKANPTVLFSFAAAGSGAGQKGFLNNDITYFEPNPYNGSANPNGYAAGTLDYGKIVGTAVDLGASDAFLSVSTITSPTEANPQTGLLNATNGSYIGYDGSSSTSGPLIQIPTIGVPITIAFNPPTGDKITTLDLTDAQVCGIFSGKITNWDQITSPAVASSPITIVYRSDSSGTTFLLTQHLDVVCNSTNSSFSSTVLAKPTKTFASLFTNVTTSLPGSDPESGSSNLAKDTTNGKGLLNIPGSIGYESPDYTAIAPKSANTTTLQTASLYNAVSKAYYTPSVANTETALENPGTGSLYGSPPATLAAASSPISWVPQVPQPSKGYPIVGYTTLDLSSCYATKAVGTALIALMTDAYTVSSYSTIITNNGFAPLTNTGAAKFAAAIQADFLTNSSGYNLNIDNATTCASYTGR